MNLASRSLCFPPRDFPGVFLLAWCRHPVNAILVNCSQVYIVYDPPAAPRGTYLPRHM